MQKTVLLVDDHRDTLDVYALFLGQLGYRVLLAGNGEDGVRLARESQPDVIVMDLCLPILDGWAATRRLKDDPSTLHIPIIALTAWLADHSRELALAAGCATWVVKPYSPRAMIADIERLTKPEPPSFQRELRPAPPCPNAPG